MSEQLTSSKRLRQRLKKLNATLTIETVRGQGYKVENHV